MANIRTFKNVQDEVLQWLDEAGDGDVTLALVKQAIRAAHEKRLTQGRWPFMLWPSTKTLTTNASRFYSLHEDFLRPLYFRNTTQDYFLTEYSEGNLIDGPDWTDTTNLISAANFKLDGRSEVQSQPSTVLTVTSSNVADNAVASVTVRGDTSANGIQTETILAGASGTTVFTNILKVTKSAGWLGTMTLLSGASVVLVLLAAEYGKSYAQLELLEQPVIGESIEYRFYRQPSPLVADNDRFDIPPPFEELMVWDALLDLANYNTYDQKMVQFWMIRRDEIELAMKHSLDNPQSLGRQASYTKYIPR